MDLIDIDEVAEVLGISRTATAETIHKRSRNRFPEPAVATSEHTLWDAAAVAEWCRWQIEGGPAEAAAEVERIACRGAEPDEIPRGARAVLKKFSDAWGVQVTYASNGRSSVVIWGVRADGLRAVGAWVDGKFGGGWCWGLGTAERVSAAQLKALVGE
jgi:predicted DNA-binding transcriptional regulator AlpA